MAIGLQDKYDDLAEDARIDAGADGVVLLIINGCFGSGFSVQLRDAAELSAGELELISERARLLVAALREVADQIEHGERQIS